MHICDFSQKNQHNKSAKWNLGRSCFDPICNWVDSRHTLTYTHIFYMFFLLMFPVYSLRCRFISNSTVNSLSSNHFVHFKTLIDRYISNCNLSDRMNVISMFIWELYRKSDFYRIEFQENIFNSDLWIVQYSMNTFFGQIQRVFINSVTDL